MKIKSRKRIKSKIQRKSKKANRLGWSVNPNLTPNLSLNPLPTLNLHLTLTLSLVRAVEDELAE